MLKKDSKEVVKVEPGKSSLEEMERRFAEFLRRPFSLMGPSWFPSLRMPEAEPLPVVDIFEDAGHVVVKAELPGMKKEDIDVKLTDSTITISGEKRREEKVAKKDYYRIERSHGSFTRAYGLPSEVQADKVKAHFRDGILEIKVPKTEEARKKEKKVLIE